MSDDRDRRAREPLPLAPKVVGPLPALDDPEGEGRSVRRAVGAFAAGVLGSALAAAGLTMFAVRTQCSGAARSLGIDRERRARCLELGVTPEQLDALEPRPEGAR